MIIRIPNTIYKGAPLLTWYPQTRAFTLQLTQQFSQTDAASETTFGLFLRDLLSSWPNFKSNPDDLLLERTQDDPHERYVLYALVRGQGRQTLILTGHYDVVGIDNYGALAGLACDPEKLLPALIGQLEAESQSGREVPSSDRLALTDLRGGDFLPGRGALDMKSGLAAGLAVLERFLAQPEEIRPGNLLFIAVPDEETASNGMRSATRRLAKLAEEWCLDLVGAINLDASDDHGNGRLGQAAYMGSIGKLLPAVYLVGRETHAGSPFQGINAALLAAELTRRIECQPGLADQTSGEFTPPPICLKMTDTKRGYDVTTPTAVWCYYNWLTLNLRAQDVLERVCELAREALDAAVTSIVDAASRYAAMTGTPPAELRWPVQVYRFEQVKSLALERGGEPARGRLEKLEAELSADPNLDTPTVCLKLIEMAWAESGLAGPAAVVGFAALYYPPAFVNVEDERGRRFQAAIQRQAETLGSEKSTPIEMRPFFPGISDMSFLGGQVASAEMDVLSANSPAWRNRSGADFGATALLNLPAANIGPWGRDYHQRIERVYMPYSFEVLPELLWRIQEDLLREPSKTASGNSGSAD
jgi:arginine utilization protein RocB